MILDFDKFSLWLTESVIDSTEIERWCWINLKGNNGLIYRTVSTEKPCGKPITSHMELVTVYAQ